MGQKIKAYFDFAAATPLDKKVFEAMKPFFSENFYNPSAIYENSRQVKRIIKSKRAEIARILGSRDSEIIFTAGATEANNLAVMGVMRKYPGSNMVVSSIEHESVIEPAKNFNYKYCPVDSRGFIQVSELEKLIDQKTVMISVMLANNEIGTIQPIKKIAELLSEIRIQRLKKGNKTPIYLHTDAAQAVNYLDIHVSRLGVDLMSINGGKIYGPKQSGLLFVKTGIDLEPLMYGGGQENGLRSGTENVPAIVGLSEAIKICESGKKTEAKRLKQLQDLFIKYLDDKKIDYKLNGSIKNRLPNNINISLPGTDNETMLIMLDNNGYMVATGSACGAKSDEPSHVLTAINCDKDEINSSLRITMGRSTTNAQVIGLATSLKNLLKT